MRSFRSRVDPLPLTAVIVALCVIDIATLGVTAPLLEQEQHWLPFLLFCIAAALPVLMALIAVPVRYRFMHRGLEIRSGLSLRWHIPISSIHRVVPVRSLRPAPALSAHRLRVDFQDGTEVRSLQISPVTQDLFLHHLTSLDEGLNLENRAVLRHGGPVLLFDALAS